MTRATKNLLTSSHWGMGVVEIENGQITAVRAHPADLAPSALNDNIPASLTGAARVRRPAVRRSWLEGTPGKRGEDAFVEVSWDRALDLIADELIRVRKDHGNQAIFAGSYGWASAGRFHHAQSQLKRFLNTQGGFLRSEGNYSYNTALVTMPYIVGDGFRQNLAEATRWSVIAQHSDLVVSFGGLAMRNMQICDGGNAKHRIPGLLDQCATRGVKFVNLSPMRTDMEPHLNAEWLAPMPGSDTAVMMGLAHTLMVEGLHDPAFLERYTVGFDKVVAYLNGDDDGVVKDADWASAQSGLSAIRIRTLAREMAASRTMITCAAGLQRADFGEQPLWMVVTLAAMLGQIGLPGGGYGIGYAVNGHVGAIGRPFDWGSLPQGKNPVEDFIPVAMISDLLLNPGQSYQYEGQTRHLPDTKMVWWAGGNPFHHHQDLNRLRAAFQRPDTIIVNELNWTATARHADIVLPIAAPQERRDFGAGKTDNILVPMPKLVKPAGEARTEYDIFSDLARRLGNEQAFTEGRSEEQWLENLWAFTMHEAKAQGIDLPTWQDFMAGDMLEMPDPLAEHVFLSDFRADPAANPRPTPSGRLELFSETVAAWNIADCPGQAVWRAPRDRAAGLEKSYPLALISGQPGTRLHSQNDNGAVSLAQKVQGREPVVLHPKDAATRGISDGDIVELFNDRGRCLAGAQVSDAVMPGVAFLWTGAWYDPDFDAPENRDRHGNPNVLTHDRRTCAFSQGPASHSALIEVRKFDGTAPPVMAHQPPAFAKD